MYNLNEFQKFISGLQSRQVKTDLSDKTIDEIYSVANRALKLTTVQSDTDIRNVSASQLLEGLFSESKISDRSREVYESRIRSGVNRFVDYKNKNSTLGTTSSLEKPQPILNLDNLKQQLDSSRDNISNIISEEKFFITLLSSAAPGSDNEIKDKIRFCIDECQQRRKSEEIAIQCLNKLIS